MLLHTNLASASLVTCVGLVRFLLGFTVSGSLGVNVLADSLARQVQAGAQDMRDLRRFRKHKSKGTKEKTAKGTKKSKAGTNLKTMVAKLAPCDNLAEGNDGIVTTHFNPSGKFFFQLQAFTLNTTLDEVNATAYIDESTICTCGETSLMNPYFDSNQDPWPVEYEVFDGGAFRSAFISNGRNLEENRGRAVVLRENDFFGNQGDILACGILQPTTYALRTVITGDDFALVEGIINIIFDPDDTMEIQYDLFGVVPLCDNCTIVIEETTNCEDVFFFDSSPFYLTDENPWVPGLGAVYISDEDGEARDGVFWTYDGFEYDEHIGRAIVVNDEDDFPIGCGVLEIA